MPFFFFFFNDTATTEIYTLSLHDALPILARIEIRGDPQGERARQAWFSSTDAPAGSRSEEHTSELQSRPHLVCRLLLEKKKTSGLAQLSRPNTPWSAFGTDIRERFTSPNS